MRPDAKLPPLRLQLTLINQKHDLPLINELCEARNCNNCIFFETRKHKVGTLSNRILRPPPSSDDYSDTLATPGPLPVARKDSQRPICEVSRRECVR